MVPGELDGIRPEPRRQRDGGTVGEHVYPDFREPSVGVGVGVRYNLGFGPVRVDVATPLNPRRGDAPVQLYLSIGQSF